MIQREQLGEFTVTRREPADEYHGKAAQFMSSHQLADFRRCPQHFRRQHLGLVPRGDSDAYRLGRAAHTLILEGWEQLENEYSFGGPINAKTNKPFGRKTKAWHDAEREAGKPILDADEQHQITAMCAAVHSHRKAVELFRGGEPELTVRGSYVDVACQVRLDWVDIKRGIAVDIKTCADLEKFEYDAGRFNYLNQFAFYAAIAETAFCRHFDFYTVAVEKSEPFRAGVWLVSGDALHGARQRNERTLKEYREAIANDHWVTRFEDLRILS